ncbi:MAG: TrbC/VirB2 family protein [Pseudoxanthomonas sp.]
METRKSRFARSALRAIALSGKAALLMAVLILPAFADNSGFSDTQDSMCSFLGNINSLLTYASIAVVTIAVIFAGYQIAFAHKRIADVAPILIGGLLIGAAGQIAAMIMPDNSQQECQGQYTT